MKALRFLVEGHGDVEAVPALVGKLLAELPIELQQALYPVSNKCIRVGDLHAISGPKQNELSRFLKLAMQHKNVGAILLVLDGDKERFEGQPFCAKEVAITLANRAKDVGAGVTFSFAVVFLLKEYESILIAAADQLPGLDKDTVIPQNPENNPQDAKVWLADHLSDGYNPVPWQLKLTQSIRDWSGPRRLRCFRRLENALRELSESVINKSPIITPAILDASIQSQGDSQ